MIDRKGPLRRAFSFAHEGGRREEKHLAEANLSYMRIPLRSFALTLSLSLLGGTLLVGATATAGPGPGYFASDNVEWVTNIPVNTDSAGARLKGNFFYITSSNSLQIYDVTEPIAPQRVGILPLPQQPAFAEEDVDTNGRIVLISTLGTLFVVDVEDKTNPAIIGELDNADQHTYTCVLDCKYAYGSGGIIVDLKDPTAPKEAGDWGDGMPASSGHDVTEIKPGLIMTSTQPLMFLDARKNPTKPKLLAVGANEDRRFIHSNLWPRAGKDKFLLVGGESSGPSCDEGSGAAFMTWDVTKIGKTRTFSMIDEYYVKNGLPTDGDALANSFCTHWFEVHPSFKNGGLLAMGWYEHGTRFLEVTPKGQIKENGYFLPVGGSTSAAYWMNDEILYAVDYQRGIDILRYTGKP
jgi:hypothetical protein